MKVGRFSLFFLCVDIVGIRFNSCSIQHILKYIDIEVFPSDEFTHRKMKAETTGILFF
jgi:hypothetical protein